MKEQLPVLINMLVEMLKSTKDFVLDQAPDVARELVAYGRATHTVAVVLPVLWFLYLGFFGIKKILKLNEENDNVAFGVGMVCTLVSILSLILLLSNIDDCILSWLAPKLYILDYVKNLVK